MSVTTHGIRQIRRVPSLPATFLMAACFLSQVFFLPVFVYSFLLLLVIYGLMLLRPHAGGVVRATGLMTWKGLVLGALLALAAINTVNIKSLVFFLTSLSCAALVIRIDALDPRLKMRAAQWFVGLSLLTIPVGAVWLVVFHQLEGIFVFDTLQGTIRFRGLNIEPNHLGFALCAAYVLLLFDPDGVFFRRRGMRLGLLAAVWLLVGLTRSPFALGTLFVVSVPFLWRNLRGHLVILLSFFFLAVLAGQSERVQLVLSGGDSSANFRTWGALVIGYLQMANCGPLGCGLGSSRNVLADEPLMSVFAAQESLVLPNLLAGTMVEGGYAMLIFAFLAILFAAFPPRRAMRSPNMSLSVFLLLLLYAASGSYPYDAQFWSITGLLAAAVRVRRLARFQPLAKDRPSLCATI